VTIAEPSSHPVRSTPLPLDPTAKTLPPGRGGDIFGVMASWTARASGGRWAFLLALTTVLVWAASGSYFHYSEMWQLVINTGTTIVTFLMVFLIQHAQNHESKAIHLKLDELIRALRTARNEIIDIESLNEEQLDRLVERYHKLAARPHKKLQRELDGVREEVSEVEDRVDEVADQVEEVERKVERTAAAVRESAASKSPSPGAQTGRPAPSQRHQAAAPIAPRGAGVGDDTARKS
jgi:low affinity Fe/Cu permease